MSFIIYRIYNEILTVILTPLRPQAAIRLRPWIMTGSLEKTFTETYIYTTMRTRKYLAGMLRDTTFVTVTENTPEATA